MDTQILETIESTNALQQVISEMSETERMLLFASIISSTNECLDASIHSAA